MGDLGPQRWTNGPVTVEAIRFRGNNYADIVAFCRGRRVSGQGEYPDQAVWYVDIPDVGLELWTAADFAREFRPAVEDD